ncbi:hypothetical protein F5Y16DRAFT_51605 [Xylariaceae sp. FL0255]|nr:hypothetical protein F5Y16DRAFT_51605 [Xylariaceae sp. FL0255]
MATPSTTIVPFASLPSCALSCGPLYDANGACVPPVNTATATASWDSCFCSYGELQPFSTGTAGVCDSACTAQAGGLGSIQAWFTSLCDGDKAVTTTSSSASPTNTSTKGSGGSSSGGSWASTHVQWIVFIVIVVVAIIGIWTGACIWRRRYLKKKDRLYELGKGLPSSVAVNTQGRLVNAGGRGSTISTNEPGMFMSGSGGAPASTASTEKRSKWGRRS